jgi:protease I
MELSGKRVVVFIDNSYQELEVWYPYLRFREAGINVVFAAADSGETYSSKYGYPAKADKSYDELSVSDYDGVVVPGGFAPDRIRRHSKANLFVKHMDDAGKLVASICHGGWVLCSAHGLLKGRRATSFFAIKDDVVHAGANWEDAEVVVDKNLVTSRKPEDLPAFCRACLQVLSER